MLATTLKTGNGVEKAELVGVKEFDAPWRDGARSRLAWRVREQRGGEFFGGGVVRLKTAEVEEHHAGHRDDCFTAATKGMSVGSGALQWHRLKVRRRSAKPMGTQPITAHWVEITERHVTSAARHLRYR